MEVVQQGDPYLCVVVGIGKYRDNTIQYEYHTCRRRWPEGEKAGIPNKPEFRRLHLLVAACFLPVNLLPASPSRSFRYHCYYYLPLLDLKGSTYCTLRAFLPSLPWPLSPRTVPFLPPPVASTTPQRKKGLCGTRSLSRYTCHSGHLFPFSPSSDCFSYRASPIIRLRPCGHALLLATLRPILPPYTRFPRPVPVLESVKMACFICPVIT